SAVEESIDCILDVSELKKTGRLRTLIVSGCMVERYKGNLREELPEVDVFLTTDQVLDVGQALNTDHPLSSLLESSQRPYFLYDDSAPRILSSGNFSAYVKISEGCNRPCSFCIIPQLRGPLRSRSVDSVVREVQHLAQQGIKEVNLIGQDLTAFGSDRKSVELSALLARLDTETDIVWVRLLYAYPLGIEEGLLTTIRNHSKICRYLDFPLQHASESVLKGMKRPLGKFSPREIVSLVRTHVPDMELRTTFIVGFPGESESDVEELASFIEDTAFTSVGIFEFSPEEGTYAADLPEQIPMEERRKRRDYLMQVQQETVFRRNADRRGLLYDVLLEGEYEESDLLLSGRAVFQAPEVDGQIIINDIECEYVPQKGDIVQVEITESAGYDLVGKIVAEK
ncbi:MAG: 30S ribosomal protein S12 methylthiotransferase RimO, partial [Bdellovibrionales bacterium]|nr:30S ribosomal protein S12 methylthiotransferase RimO [Bdellovibrionales bacterium]